MDCHRLPYSSGERLASCRITDFEDGQTLLGPPCPALSLFREEIRSPEMWSPWVLTAPGRQHPGHPAPVLSTLSMVPVAQSLNGALVLLEKRARAGKLPQTAELGWMISEPSRVSSHPKPVPGDTRP